MVKCGKEGKVGVAKGGIVKCGKSEGRLGQGRQVRQLAGLGDAGIRHADLPSLLAALTAT